MKTLRFHRYGEPADVLRLEDAEIPVPGPGHIRVRVHTCGLNPADWALCRGLFPGDLPRGVGLDVSGTVDAIGEGVTDVRVGDRDKSGLGDHDDAGSAGHAQAIADGLIFLRQDGIDKVLQGDTTMDEVRAAAG